MNDTTKARAKDETKAAPKGHVLVSCTSEQGRARAGLRFSQTPQEVDFAALSEEQVTALMGDPQLVIRPAPPKE